MTYEERLKRTTVELAKAAFKTVWEYAIESNNSGKSLEDAAVRSIAMQEASISEALTELLPEEDREYVIRGYLKSNGYIPEKEEE